MVEGVVEAESRRCDEAGEGIKANVRGGGIERKVWWFCGGRGGVKFMG